MASYLYNSYKFRYTSDEGQEFIRTQREYKRVNGIPYVPMTPIFLGAVIASNIKVQAFDGILRRLETEIPNDDASGDYSRFKNFLPYPPGNPNLLGHVKEIEELVRNQSDPYCVDYFGERRRYR